MMITRIHLINIEYEDAVGASLQFRRINPTNIFLFWKKYLKNSLEKLQSFQ